MESKGTEIVDRLKRITERLENPVTEFADGDCGNVPKEVWIAGKLWECARDCAHTDCRTSVMIPTKDGGVVRAVFTKIEPSKIAEYEAAQK